MTRDGDGDYWRRENARRAQLDRAFWWDYEQRRSREREVREYEARRLGLDSADGSLRGGDTALAMRNLAGPDAVNHPPTTRAEERSQETGSDRRHAGVQRVRIDRVGWGRDTSSSRHWPSLSTMWTQAPVATALDVGQSGHDGDIAVAADVGKRSEWGWLRRRLIAVRTFVAAPRRTGDMIAALVERGGLFGYRKSMPWTDLPSPLDSSLGKGLEQQQ